MAIFNSFLYVYQRVIDGFWAVLFSDKPSNLHHKKNVGQAPNMRPRLSAASISLVHNRRSLVAGNGTWWCSMENNVLIWLVVDLPLWKIIEWKSVGMMTFPTEWKNKTCSKPPTRKQCSVSFYILLHRKHEHETSAKIDVWNTMSTTTYSHPYHIPRTMIFHDISVCWISRHRFSPYHEIRTYG